VVGVLQDINDAYGYLPEEVLREVSQEIGVPVSTLFSLSTFYSSFRLEPIGRHHVCVCVGTACHVRGAQSIVDSLERELKINAGQTTEDQQFTLETVNCLGACALAPLVVMDEEYHGKMDQKKASRFLQALASEENDQESE
jgi:NADH-quinone oxidoreductase subunit E